MKYHQVGRRFAKLFIPDLFEEFQSELHGSDFSVAHFEKFLVSKRKKFPEDKVTINRYVNHFSSGSIKLYIMIALINGDHYYGLIAKNLRNEGAAINIKTIDKYCADIYAQLQPFNHWLLREIKGGNWDRYHQPPQGFEEPKVKKVKVNFCGKKYDGFRQESGQVSCFWVNKSFEDDLNLFCLLQSYILTCKKNNIQEFDAMCSLLNRDELAFMDFKHLTGIELKRDIIIESMINELALNKRTLTPVKFKEIIMNHAGQDRDVYDDLKKVKSWKALWDKVELMCRGATCYEMAAGEFISLKAKSSKDNYDKIKEIEQWEIPNHCTICYRLCGGDKHCSKHDYRINKAGYNRGRLIGKTCKPQFYKPLGTISRIPFEVKELREWLLIYAPTIAEIVAPKMNLLKLLSFLDDVAGPSEARTRTHRLWCGLKPCSSDSYAGSTKIGESPSSRNRAKTFVLRAEVWAVGEKELKHGGNNRKRNESLEKKISKLASEGFTQAKIGKLLGVSQALVSNCLNN